MTLVPRLDFLQLKKTQVHTCSYVHRRLLFDLYVHIIHNRARLGYRKINTTQYMYIPTWYEMLEQKLNTENMYLAFHRFEG